MKGKEHTQYALPEEEQAVSSRTEKRPVAVRYTRTFESTRSGFFQK